ncbi:MAG: hypothetical protein HQL17_02980 [Candidatus Omnitrophica bacterium]|nr:hypothetical protein [Candidatus Omnitrophota bacterium]
MAQTKKAVKKSSSKAGAVKTVTQSVSRIKKIRASVKASAPAAKLDDQALKVVEKPAIKVVASAAVKPVIKTATAVVAKPAAIKPATVKSGHCSRKGFFNKALFQVGILFSDCNALLTDGKTE